MNVGYTSNQTEFSVINIGTCRWLIYKIMLTRTEIYSVNTTVKVNRSWVLVKEVPKYLQFKVVFSFNITHGSVGEFHHNINL